jgi:uncharacterized protein YndB with AHSA1/START domain
MTEPLLRDLAVDCPVEHAFDVWTRRIDAWWPRDHTATGREDVRVVLESRVGGRIYERTSDGTEHDWGEVTVWEPPHRLAYLWHFRSDRTAATDVDIRFVAEGARTRIVIEHTGWERLGDQAPTWRDRNRMGWSTLLPHFTAAAQSQQGSAT